MRIRFASFILLITAASLLTSCLKDDDETSYNYYKDTAISSFSLGTMRRLYHTTTDEGEDSTYYTSFSASSYKFTIDQIGKRVYNTDSLPYGTDVAHSLATISSVNNGIILLKDVDSDTLYYYSSTDSIDFTEPRTLRVISQDGQRYSDYTVSVNARQTPVGTMAWENKTENSPLEQLSDLRAFALGNNICVFGSDGSAVTGYSTGINDGAEWTQLSANFTAKASIVKKGDRLYALDNGVIYRSSDGSNWEQTGQGSGLLRLVAASTEHLYALTTSNGTSADGMAASDDEGASWASENLDDDVSLLPDEEVGYACTPLRTNDSIDQVLIVGRLSSANDIVARVWTKLDDYSSLPLPTSWSFVDDGGNTTYNLKDIPTLAVTTYGGYPTALKYDGTAFSQLLQSRDGGITWKNYDIDLPDGLTGTAGKLAITADSEGSLWIISGGQVWKN